MAKSLLLGRNSYLICRLSTRLDFHLNFGSLKVKSCLLKTNSLLWGSSACTKFPFFDTVCEKCERRRSQNHRYPPSSCDAPYLLGGDEEQNVLISANVLNFRFVHHFQVKFIEKSNYFVFSVLII